MLQQLVLQYFFLHTLVYGQANSHSCLEGYELKKRDDGRSFCHWVIPPGWEVQRGPVVFQTATDQQISSLKELEIREEFKDLNIFPTHKDTNTRYRGWVVSSEISGKPLVKVPKSMQQLPEQYTFFGREKCSFAKIVRSPTTVVQPGDILVYFEPNTKETSHSLYGNIVQGMNHAAVVVQNRKGEIMHVDAPKEWSGTKFSGKSFHILRLRPYPKEIKSKNDLDDWVADPEKRKQLASFLTERNFQVAAVNYYANRLYESGFQYGLNNDVKVLSNKEWIQSLIQQGKTQDLKFYCSEFAYTSWALAGVSKPASRNISDTLQGLSAFLEKTADSEKISRNKAVDNGIRNLAVEYTGSSNAIVNGLIRFLIPPKKMFPKGSKEVIEDILKSDPKEAEEKLKKAPQSVKKWFSESIVRPSDLFNEIYNQDSDYFYVGTYIDKPYSETSTRKVIDGQNDRSVGQCN